MNSDSASEHHLKTQRLGREARALLRDTETRHPSQIVPAGTLRSGRVRRSVSQPEDKDLHLVQTDNHPDPLSNIQDDVFGDPLPTLDQQYQIPAFKGRTSYLSSTVVDFDNHQYLEPRYSHIPSRPPIVRSLTSLHFDTMTTNITIYTPPDKNEAGKIKVVVNTPESDVFIAYSAQRAALITELSNKLVTLKKFTDDPTKTLTDQDVFQLTNTVRDMDGRRLLLKSIEKKMQDLLIQPEDYAKFYDVYDKDCDDVNRHLQIGGSLLNKKGVSLNQTASNTTLSASQLSATVNNTQLSAMRIGPTRRKLPHIALSSFSGDIRQYHRFRDEFSHFIGQDQSLSAYERMHYLSSVLSPEIKKIVDTLVWDENGYLEAWKQLDAKYDKPFDIGLAWEATLHKLPKVKAHDAQQLEKHLHSIRVALQGLNRAGKSTKEYGKGWLVYVTGKLPESLRAQWELEREKLEAANADVNVMDEYLKFLDKRQKIGAKMQQENAITGDHPNVPTNHNGHKPMQRLRVHAKVNAVAVGLSGGGKKTKPFSANKKRPKPATSGNRYSNASSNNKPSGKKPNINKAPKYTPLRNCVFCPNSSGHNPAQCKRDKNPQLVYGQLYGARICVCCLETDTHTAQNCLKRRPCRKLDNGKQCEKFHHPSIHHVPFVPYKQWAETNLQA